jgi:phenol 2-monooxygenase
MPVFQEKSNSARDLRILPSTARPLPRLSPLPTQDAEGRDKYEVVVAGVRIYTTPGFELTE